MTTFVRNSRMRRVISSVCAVAMIASIMVMPAFASETGSITSTSLSANFTGATGEYDRGVQGTLSVLTSGTPAQQASQESVNTYSESAQTTTTLAGGGPNSLNVTDGTFTLYVSVWSPLYGETAALPPGSFVSTTVPVTGLTAGTTVAQLAAAVDNALNLSDYRLAGDAYFTSTGKLRVVKRFAEGDFFTPSVNGSSGNHAEIWLHSGPAPGLIANDPPGVLTVAEAVMADAIVSWGRYSPLGDTYKYGRDNNYASIEATWTPLNGTAIGGLGSAFQYGSFVNGVVSQANFQSTQDTETGQYTAVMSNGWPGGYVLLNTAGRSSYVGTGTSYVTFGNGVRDPAIETQCSGTWAPHITPASAPTAGAVTTWTVTVDDPDSTPGTWDLDENAYNGLSVLFPKEFSVVNGPDNAAFINALVASLGSTPTVTSQNTSEGWLVTLTNFVDEFSNDTDEAMTFQVALAATTTAGLADIGAKIWIHNVGTTMTANPMVTQLIDSRYAVHNDDISANEGMSATDWFPLFCNCGTIDMTIVPDVVRTITVNADPNRAKGYTAVTVDAVDQYGNDVTGYVNYDPPTISPSGDGASIVVYPFAPDSWVWRLADTPGINSVTLVGDDSRTGADENITSSVSFNNTGFGEPAKLVIIPDEAVYDTGDNPSVIVQLQDENGNPTSWLDDHYASGGPETDLIEIVANSENNPFPFGQMNVNAYIHKGWSKSNQSASDGASGWPNFIGFPGPSAQGPDVWTFSAKHRAGSVMPAEFVSRDVRAVDPGLVNVADHIKVTAVATAPAMWADDDWIYNNKTDAYDDDAFGYAAATSDVSTASITLSAQVVDFYDNPVTNNVAFKPVTFSIPKFNYTNAVLPTGHTYETTTNADGVATAVVKSFSPTIDNRWVPGWGSSWFTPVRVDMDYVALGNGWAYPCPTDVQLNPGYGFTYFHGAKLTAGLDRYADCADKDVVLADGIDSTGFTAEVLDSALNTPIAGWDVKFTTSLGTFADGSKAVTMTTGADGKAGVVVKSSTAGNAFVRVYDRLGRTSGAPGSFSSFYQNAVTELVTFTNYKTIARVVDTTTRGGDRAWAKVIVSWQDVAGNTVTWGLDTLGMLSSIDVFGYAPNGVTPTMTQGDGDGGADWGLELDENGDGRYDAVELWVPARDITDGDYCDDYDDYQLESAGKRYPVIDTSFYGEFWVDNVFYNTVAGMPVPARPEVMFTKDATLTAEGTQWSDYLGFEGSNFTPGTDGPEDTDMVDVMLGDIRIPGDSKKIGEAYVGRDGVLLPIGLWNWYQSDIRRMSPGFYDITVDGLVFDNSLEIKNLFKSAWISINHSTANVVYLDSGQDYIVQVNAFGSYWSDVWAGSLKLKSTETEASYTLPARSMDYGLHNMVAKVFWEDNYSTVVSHKFYIRQALRFASTLLTANGRTLKVTGKVTGKAEASGNTRFSVKVTYQKFYGGHWHTYATRTVKALNGTYSSSLRVGSAGKYRVRVSHSDLAHPYSYKYSNSKTVR